MAKNTEPKTHLSKWPKTELVKKAKKLGIEGADDMTCKQLITAIQNFTPPTAKEPTPEPKTKNLGDGKPMPTAEEAAPVETEEIVEEQTDIPCPDDPGAVAAFQRHSDAFTEAAVKQAALESKEHKKNQKAVAKEEKLAQVAVEAGIVAEEEARIERERLGVENHAAVT